MTDVAAVSAAADNTDATTSSTTAQSETPAKVSKKLLSASKANSLKELVQTKDGNIESLLSKSYLGRVQDQLEAQGVDVSKLTLPEVSDKAVRVIVTLKGDAALEKADYKVGSVKGADKAENSVLKDQSAVQKQVKKITGNKVVQEFGYLLNGFSIDASMNQIAEIEKLADVESVEVSSVKVTQDTDQAELVQATKSWEKYHYQGEGMVVAVIDSGIDTKHKDLRLTDESTAAISKDEAESAIEAMGYGKYESAKVPFAYNYADANTSQLYDTGVQHMHGMHVAGIIAANGEDANNIDSVRGIAPEAQLLDMKVFANLNTSGLTSDTVVQAIEDAVKLGADVFNMSMGSDDGGASEDNAEVIAVNAAAEAGVIPVISAGNSGVQSSQGGQGNVSQFENTDDGLIGKPAIAENAIAVASSENTTRVGMAAVISRDNAPILNGLQVPVQVNEDAVDNYFGAAFQYVVLDDKTTALADGTAIKPVEVGLAGRGFKTDYEGTGVAGKIVVVSRGDNSFIEKQNAAKEAGAAGLIVVNNVNTDDGQGAIDNGNEVPTLFIPKDSGVQFIADIKANPTAKYSMSDYENTFIKSPNQAAYKISTFSSWGPNTDLALKPDITAPGGHIWSLMNDNKYQIMSGTSMSSPAVAGSEALILQSFKANGVTLEGLDLVNAAKLTSMNTSVPILDPDHDNAPYSPRLQGTGQIGIVDAMNNFVTLTFEDSNKGNASLKQIGASTEFTVTLTNNGTKAATYTYNDFGGVYTQAQDATNVIYDTKVKDASITSDKAEVTVQPGESQTVTLNLSLPESFATNQYAEGFIGFDSTDASIPSLSMDYMGFYGNWNDAPVFDAPAGTADSKYFSNYFVDSKTWNTLGLDLSTSDVNSFKADPTIPADEKNVANWAAFVNPDKVALSPNDDGWHDCAFLNALTLRNVKTLQQTVTNEKGDIVRKIDTDYDGLKRYIDPASGTEININFSINPESNVFDGEFYNQKTGEKEPLPDGQYYYNVAGTIDADDAEAQTLTLQLKLIRRRQKLQMLNLKKMPLMACITLLER